MALSSGLTSSSALPQSHSPTVTDSRWLIINRLANHILKWFLANDPRPA